MISFAPSPSKSPTGPKSLSPVFSSQPPKRVPFGAIVGTVNVPSESFSTPIPHGLVTRISAAPSPSKSPTGPNELSPVFSPQPPNRVPFGAIIGAPMLAPTCSSTPRPHGLVTSSSARPSPSYSAAGPNALSPVLSSQPP